MRLLPASVSEVAEVVGRKKALLLCHMAIMRAPKRYDGRRQTPRVYVPNSIHEGHPIAQCIGLDAARELSKVFGASDLQLSHCSDLIRDWYMELTVRMTVEGMTTEDIADILRLSPRHIRRWRAELQPTIQKRKNSSGT